MLSVLHGDSVQGLRRLPVPTGWRGRRNQPQPMLCPFSENSCRTRQAMGSKTTFSYLTAKGISSSLQHKKHRGGAVFPFSFLRACFLLFFETGLKLVRPRAISYLPGRPQLRVRPSHHGSATSIFPLIVFAQFSILQVKKQGRASNT